MASSAKGRACKPTPGGLRDATGVLKWGPLFSSDGGPMTGPDGKETQPGTRPPDTDRTSPAGANSDTARRAAAARHLEEQLDEALADSFPASDPVSFVTSQTEEDWADEPPPPKPGS